MAYIIAGARTLVITQFTDVVVVVIVVILVKCRGWNSTGKQLESNSRRL